MNAFSNARLVQDGQLNDSESVRHKVEQDIAFLTDRIASLEAHHRPNQPVIDTYRAMLESRRSVLNWFNHGRMNRDEPSPRGPVPRSRVNGTAQSEPLNPWSISRAGTSPFG